MIKINLLPFRAARRKENIRRQLTVYVLSVVLVFLVAGYLFLDVTTTLSALANEKAAQKKELNKYADTIKKIKAIEKKVAEIEEKLNVIKELEKNKTGPVRLLDEIAMAIPKDRLWLKSIQEKKGSLSLVGTAMDNDTVAIFMTNLEKSPQITSVDLKSTKLQNLKAYKLNVSNFSLTCKTYSFKEKKKTTTKKRRRK
ncbi:MAG: PilN domain-containing protein [Desulfobacterales bacterium]|nr:PilN domain-containing protein [Desulfobacterales bacterium]